MDVGGRTVGVVVLMAGRSSRMQGSNKLLIPIESTKCSVAEHTIQSIVKAGYESILVVTGHDSELLKEALNAFDVQWIHNLRYKEGMGTSIAKAFEIIEDWDAALIALGDMPFVSVNTLKLLREVSNEHPSQIIAPSHDGRRGQPVIFPARFFRYLRECTGEVGGKRVLQAHPESVMLVDVRDEGIHWDVDTEDMLRRYSKRSRKVKDD